jgi:glutamyl-tRNA reductase
VLTNLAAVGISHHTAPVEVREKMWLSVGEIREALARLRERSLSECLLISTCNRTELYGLLPDGLSADELDIPRFLIDLKAASGIVHPGHFRLLSGGSAIEHLFTVAAGIDSLVIGDIQILNQVKEAFHLAREAHSLGLVLNRLMQSALHVGKRVRTETRVVEGAVSVSYAAVELAGKIFADLATKSALLVGAGETGELTLKHLIGKGIGTVSVANRTRERAEALVAALGGAVVEFEQLESSLAGADIVITSVASPEPVIGFDLLRRAVRPRSNRPLILIDIGVPRNIDPAVRKLENIFLYDIDSLHTVVDRNMERRRSEIPLVSGIVEEEVRAFLSWVETLKVGPTIQELRDAFEQVRRDEVEKNINRFAVEDRELLDLVTRRIINKILHQPVTALKRGTEGTDTPSDQIQRIATLRALFGIGRDKGDPDERE